MYISAECHSDKEQSGGVCLISHLGGRVLHHVTEVVYMNILPEDGMYILTIILLYILIILLLNSYTCLEKQFAFFP